eukprot:3545781-Rhodomonas_salina.2
MLEPHISGNHLHTFKSFAAQADTEGHGAHRRVWNRDVGVGVSGSAVLLSGLQVRSPAQRQVAVPAKLTDLNPAWLGALRHEMMPFTAPIRRVLVDRHHLLAHKPGPCPAWFASSRA